MSALGLPRRGLPKGRTHPRPYVTFPTKRLLHVEEGLGSREQHPPAGSAQRGNLCLTEVSHSFPLGG